MDASLDNLLTCQSSFQFSQFSHHTLSIQLCVTSFFMERYLIDVIGPVLKPARVTAIHRSIKFALLLPNVQVALLCETKNSACSAESEACRVRKQTALHPLVIVCCLGLTGRHIQGVSSSKYDAEHILSFIFSNLLKDKLNLTFPDCLLPSSKLSPPSLDR